MPLFSASDCGTSSDGSTVEAYCRFCFQEGRFSSECTMDEMIQLCAKYTDSWPNSTGQPFTRKEAVDRMRLQFPLLRRWAQKEETQHEYFKSISKALDYMHAHVKESPGLEQLSSIACLSPYHFHRMFKAVIGETTGAYGLRLRMEHVARHLRSGHKSVDELAAETGYNGTSALSKAFKKFYGVPPSVYRSMPHVESENRTGKPAFEVDRRCIPSFTLACTPVSTEGSGTEAFAEAWKRLDSFLMERFPKATDIEAIGISLDGHDSNTGGRHLFYACLTVEAPFVAEHPFSCFTIEGGMYAVFSLKGSYRHLAELYRHIYFEWLPASHCRLRNGFSFEKYIDNPLTVPEKEARTEVYLPIA